MRRRLENPVSTRATWDTWFDLVSVPGSTLKSRRVGFLISVHQIPSAVLALKCLFPYSRYYLGHVTLINVD
jgi:hypothetical protein